MAIERLNWFKLAWIYIKWIETYGNIKCCNIQGENPEIKKQNKTMVQYNLLATEFKSLK